MTDYEYLIDYLAKNIAKTTYSSGSGLSPEFPDFELMPFDYLEFAEQELASDSISSRIGCASNLKRATECEMDTLIHMLGLSKQIKSFPKKVDFISKAGLISSRSLDKLNKIRNKMEHEYSIPEIDELEAYFDLASGFVHTVEGYLFMLTSHAEQEWEYTQEPNGVAFRVELSDKPAKITFNIKTNEGYKTLEFGATEFDIYQNALRVFFLLCRSTTLISKDYVISKLTGIPLYTSPGRG